jgi:hypothetical protein
VDDLRASPIMSSGEMSPRNYSSGDEADDKLNNDELLSKIIKL